MLKITALGLYTLNQYVFLFMTVSGLVRVFFFFFLGQPNFHHHFYFYVEQDGDSKSMLTICEMNGSVKAVQTSV